MESATKRTRLIVINELYYNMMTDENIMAPLSMYRVDIVIGPCVAIMCITFELFHWLLLLLMFLSIYEDILSK